VALPFFSRRICNPMEEARGWEEDTHPLRQRNGDRRERNGRGFCVDVEVGDLLSKMQDLISLRLDLFETECQSAMAQCSKE